MGKEKEKKAVEEEDEELTEEKLGKALDSLEEIANKEFEPTKKDEDTSFVEKAKENSDDIKKGMEVSDFLSDIVVQVGGSIDSMNDLIKSEVTGVRESVQTIAKSLKDVGEATLELTKRMTELEKAPVGARKSVLNKSETGIQRFDVDEELNKSQALNKMINLVQKGDNIVTPDDVISFENSGRIRPEVKELLYN